MLILWVAAGGALGSVLRFLLSKAAGEWLGHGFPWGTLGVNVLGSFAAGALYVLLVERGGSPEWRAALMIGLLGGFTTFSAFSIDSLRLAEEVGVLTALANVLANVGLSLGACAAAIWLGRHWA
jgi:fluoride exporter